MPDREKARAREARYRKNRRARLGEEADKARARNATNRHNAKHRDRVRATHRDSYNRKAQLERKLNHNPLRVDTDETPGRGFAVVTASAIRHDLTRWHGPGQHRERQLEAQADEILKRAERSAERAAHRAAIAATEAAASRHEPTDERTPYDRMVSTVARLYLEHLRR